MNTVATGYRYDEELAASPVSTSQLAEIEQSLLWTAEDQAALRGAGPILVPQTEAILDVWYGFVGANPHLVATFAGKGGEPDGAYLAAVRTRFGLWIKDLCERDFDDQWLAYQQEIGLRHHPIGKNATDQVDSPAGHVPLRHLIALIVPITVTIRGFLESGESAPARVEAMYQAWFKAVTLSVVMWTRPYTPELW
ncbi:MAG TPA: protoglobin domain-containing protein [Homoserinimonas sp.]|nr:protoglobin domain-containing protein [Homoserinimonas sp.]